ncbi:DinB family protein [uncultured Deinococcus sp.]|uniref:DinB family protein n=1 Tax=uncultured Deinococcus sp. TaxID=158789 RepID=UPI00258DE63C|nr:DinB family protein [uncultured Deinococcus sp.]
MNVPEYYAYLAASRAQLWDFLRALPPEDLDRDVIGPGDRFHSVKDLLLHVSDVEDHWIHAVARGDGVGVAQRYPHDWVRPQAGQYSLAWIIDYGREIGEMTQRYLGTAPDLSRRVKLVHDDPESDTVTLEQLFWHVMTHEVRHVAQITLLVRQQGHTPPWLDYLRFARPQVAPSTAGTDFADSLDPEDFTAPE